MDHPRRFRQQKYLFFLMKLVEFICDALPPYQDIFSDQRTKYWDSLSQRSLNRILQRIVRHTPCRILSQAFVHGLLTTCKRVMCVVGDTLQRSEKHQARCLQTFLEYYESK